MIEQTMSAHENAFVAQPTLEDILAIDAWAREQVDVEAERLAKGKILIH